jgi:anti-anti-sigma regulatory factor
MQPFQHGQSILFTERDCLVIAVQSPQSDEELSQLCSQVTRRLWEDRPGGAVLDLSGLDVADSFTVKTLRDLCQILRLYGIKTVLACIQPQIAMCMAMRGLSIEDVAVAGDLREAFEYMGPALRRHPHQPRPHRVLPTRRNAV